jgi:hypothetical protein
MDLYAFENSPDFGAAVWDEPEVVTNLPAATHVERGLRQEDTPLQPGLALAKPIAINLLGLPVDCKPALVAAISCICANFCELPVRQATWVFYSRDNNHYANLARYVPDFYRRPIMIEAVKILAAAGLVVHQRTRPSPNAAYRSRIRPTQKLQDRLSGLVGLVTAYTPREAIVLRGTNGKPVSYRETKGTSVMRRDVQTHNAFLQAFSIHVVHPDVAYEANGILLVTTGLRLIRLNTARNAYYRVFNERFDRGGRWYGPFWQSLPSSVREGVRINGEETCEPDIRGCHMRLLCAGAGIALGPDEDPYDGLGPPRKEIKLAVNVMLNARSWRSARGALVEKLASRYGPSVGTQADLLRAAIEKHFPALSLYWNSGHGLHLQTIDAEVCAEIQRRLRADDIPCLSVHDSFIVPKSAEGQTVALMNEVFDRACAKLRAER